MDEIYIRNNAESYGVPIIREASHSLLIDIVKKHNPQQILEIGTAVGYSGIAMLKSGTGKLTTVDHDRKRLEEAKINFADAHLENRVQIIEDDCLVTILYF
jgi:predicted O-methyltransferase YrrM